MPAGDRVQIEPEPERRERLIRRAGELDSRAIQAVAHSLCERVEGEGLRINAVPHSCSCANIVGIARYIQDPEARVPTGELLVQLGPLIPGINTSVTSMSIVPE